jgi:hypothetical protein
VAATAPRFLYAEITPGTSTGPRPVNVRLSPGIGGYHRLGGRLEHFYFAFGQDDLLVICDLPDNQSAAAFSLAINNTGKARGYVTPLMTPEEMDEAITKSPDYRAPGES